MSNIVRLVMRQRSLGDASDRNQLPRPEDRNQSFREEEPFTNLGLRGVAVGQLLATLVRVGWHRVPEDHPMFGSELVEHTVHDRA